jgi:thiamine kinase-like enzyme
MNLKIGLSGCTLEKIDNTIRKYSSSESYNQRLLKQSEKQEYFSRFIFTRLSTPRVISRGDSYFDMEYIQASSFNTFLNSADVNQLDFICEGLYEYFEFLIEHSRTQNIKTKVMNKLDSLEQTPFIDYLKSLDVDYDVPKSFCHGDLTFTNILFHKKKLYFIDFLDSFVDTFYVDLCKLKQDLYYHWSIRLHDGMNVRLYQSTNYIWKNIEERYKKYINTLAFDVLDVVNLLRIQPYLKNQEDKTILSYLIQNTKLYENFNCSYGGTV